MSTIAIACGGTGGHIYPGLTLGAALEQEGFQTFFMGSSTRMEKDLIPAAGYSFAGVPVRQLNKKRPLSSLLNWWHCTQQAKQIFKQQKPIALIGMGSYITVPALLAARQLGIPIFLVEANVVPGKANQWLARLAEWVAIAHPLTAKAFPKTKTHLTGYPVRSEFGQIDRKQGAAIFGLDPALKTLTVMGGSQGAQKINQAVATALADLLADEKLQVVHVCGASNIEQVRALTDLYASHPRYRLLEYVENMPALLAATDLALSRAGASTLAELMVCEVPVILVPGQFGGGHQQDNAISIVEAGAGTLLEETQLSAQTLTQQVQNVISNTEKYQQMKQNTKQLNPGSASQHIISLLLNSLQLPQKETVTHA